MKILVILAIILAVIAAYFILNTEKSISIGDGGNAVPAGIDVAKFLFNKALNRAGKINEKTNDSGNYINSSVLQSKLAEEIKSKIGETKDKILDEAINLIKNPIENKINALFCPAK